MGRGAEVCPDDAEVETAGASGTSEPRPDRSSGKHRRREATHMTYAMAQTFGQGSSVVNVPATLPVSPIVKRLNELQPLTLRGYPSMISVLAREAQDGSLRIAPLTICMGSEPILPEMRDTHEST